MTTTHDPSHPSYLDEADVRGELTRVFDLCHGCRLCFKFCTSFPTLFSYVDAHESQDAGLLTPAQQDQVIDECFGCKLCYVNCPYVPGQHEWAIDFPRLILRAQAMRRATGQVGLRERMTTAVMGHTDLVGALASSTAPLANRVTGAAPGSVVRRVLAATAGVSSVRLLPPYVRTRFSTWFARRRAPGGVRARGRVAVFPTCLVEYQTPRVGRDLVAVYERNGIECTIAGDARCCGAPYLHSGDLEGFRRVARRQVKTLAAVVREGLDIVVPQPTCAYVLKKDYPDYVGGEDARLVSEHVRDSSEYLIDLHRGADGALDSDFTGEIPASITYHVPCHLKAQNIGLRSRDLMRLTGAKVVLADQCSGTDGMWGLRAGNEPIAVSVAARLAARVTQASSEVVAGDCHLANTAIAEQTGAEVLHPMSILARAYGITDGGDR